MRTTIHPSTLSGSILAPASKSSMQRACAAALLRNGTTIIRQPGHSNDDKAALGVIRDLGATITPQNDLSFRIQSHGLPSLQIGGAGLNRETQTREAATATREVNCGESGLGLRMFAPIIALTGQPIRVIGEGSLLNRPMDLFDEVFPQLGIHLTTNGGKLPLRIKGPLQPRNIEIDGSLSSQFLTGLLLAFHAAHAKDVTIRVRQLKSRPYIDLTLHVMRHFGWHVENRNYEEFYFSGRPDTQPNTQPDTQPDTDTEPDTKPDTKPGDPLEYTVEGDWSGGAFLLVAGAIAGPITIKGLDAWSTQADKTILQALCDCGAQLETGEEQMRIGPGRMKAFRFDATDCPDLFPPLVALAAHCEGTTVISGVSRLAHKESNRGLTLQEEFGKMGIAIDLAGDTMLIRGGAVKSARVHSRHDHRIAMACAVAALRAQGELTIEEAQAIDKSYPDFYHDLQRLGGEIKILEI